MAFAYLVKIAGIREQDLTTLPPYLDAFLQLRVVDFDNSVLLLILLCNCVCFFVPGLVQFFFVGPIFFLLDNVTNAHLFGF